MKKKAIVIAGSRGIGKAISDELINLNYQVTATSTKSVDTSNLEDINKFIKLHKKTDVLVLNTGGPPAKKLKQIKKEDWEKYFKQLFLSMVTLLQNIKVSKNGYVFLISSFHIKQPDENLVLSNAYRVALSSVLKTYGTENLKNNITTLNFALGPFYTDRLKNLNPGLSKKEIGKGMPLGRVGETREVAKLVSCIILNEIKYLNCQTIFIDGGISNNLF
tara:strand:- start:220 stop:876 length:657 start_codon:yes stop_codon:yes gene_type:complete